MLLFVFIGIFLTWLYFKERPWIHLIVIGSILGILLRAIKMSLNFSNIEGFQDDTVSANELSQAILGQEDQTKIIVELFQKYQDLLRENTKIKGGLQLTNAECSAKLSSVQTDLAIALKQYQDYRNKIKNTIPVYLKNNYIRKDKIQEFIDKSCDFKSYDVTKHPDFQNKCANPAFFAINKHQDYSKVQNIGRQITNWSDFKVTDHPDFVKECQLKCTTRPEPTQPCKTLNEYDVSLHPNFIPECQKRVTSQFNELQKDLNNTKTQNRELINNNQDLVHKNRELNNIKVQNQELASKNQELVTKTQELVTQNQGLVTQNQGLANKNQGLADKDQELNTIKKQYQGLVNKTKDLNTIKKQYQGLANKTQELANKNQELTRKNQELSSKHQVLTSKNQGLANKNKELTGNNEHLKQSLKTQLSDFKVQSVRDCPNLENLLTTIREQI